MAGVYVIRVDFPDGTAVLPARIDRDRPDWQADLDEASAHFERLYRGRAIVSYEYASRPGAIPAAGGRAPPPWRELRREIAGDDG